MKLILEYNPTGGMSVPDGSVNEFVDETLKNMEIFYQDDHPYERVVCNFAVIDEIRARIAEGKVNHKDIVFYFKGDIIKINEYGAITVNWPKGFGDGVIDRCRRILRAANDKRKNKVKKNLG